jgi:hypothetical protein
MQGKTHNPINEWHAGKKISSYIEIMAGLRRVE